MYVDGALSEHEVASLQRHAATCAFCSARIGELRRENALLRRSLRSAEGQGAVPPLVLPSRRRDVAVLIASALLVSAIIKALLSMVAALIPSGLGWWSLFDLAIDVVVVLVYQGSAMWTAIRNFIGAALILAFVAWLTFLIASRIRRRGST
jgi:anti-sigma factor RsiW